MVTILAKNFIVFAVSSLAFLILGFGLTCGDGKIFVGGVEEVVRIRTGEDGTDAI
jgi:ammonia channel protein AmtB